MYAIGFTSFLIAILLSLNFLFTPVDSNYSESLDIAKADNFLSYRQAAIKYVFYDEHKSISGLLDDSLFDFTDNELEDWQAFIDSGSLYIFGQVSDNVINQIQKQNPSLAIGRVRNNASFISFKNVSIAKPSFIPDENCVVTILELK